MEAARNDEPATANKPCDYEHDQMNKSALNDIQELRQKHKRALDKRDADHDKKKLLKRLEANRRSAAESRQRRLNLIASLQQTIANMAAVVANLERENSDLRHHINYRRMSQAQQEQEHHHHQLQEQMRHPPPQQQQQLTESPGMSLYQLHSRMSHTTTHEEDI